MEPKDDSTKKFGIWERKGDAWWQPSIVISTKIFAWIIIPILTALFLGKWLDNKWGTDPWIFLTLTILAFLVSSVNIVLIAIRFTKKIEAEAKEKKLTEEKNNESSNQQ